jgi:hypothetical protein
MTQAEMDFGLRLLPIRCINPDRHLRHSGGSSLHHLPPRSSGSEGQQEPLSLRGDVLQRPARQASLPEGLQAFPGVGEAEAQEL